MDFKRESRGPIHINRMAVEHDSSFKFLGTHIADDLSWTTNTSSLVNKGLLPEDSILTSSATEHKALWQLVKTAQRITGTPLPAIT